MPAANQLADFMGNHDELTLDKLTDAEREEVFAALTDPDMRSFGRGIRRRVPSMLDGERDRMELLYSLLFALPGIPVLLYGEEVGLGDDQRVEGRGAVRVAMQWTPGPDAGFTTGDPAVPLVTQGPFGAGPGERGRPAPRSPSRCSTGWSGPSGPARSCPSSAGGPARCSTPTYRPCWLSAATGKAEESWSSTTSDPR